MATRRDVLTKKERSGLVRWLVKEYGKYGFDKKSAQEYVDFYYPKNYNPKNFSKKWTA